MEPWTLGQFSQHTWELDRYYIRYLSYKSNSFKGKYADIWCLLDSWLAILLVDTTLHNNSHYTPVFGSLQLRLLPGLLHMSVFTAALIEATRAALFIIYFINQTLGWSQFLLPIMSQSVKPASDGDVSIVTLKIRPINHWWDIFVIEKTSLGPELCFLSPFLLSPLQWTDSVCHFRS